MCVGRRSEAGPGSANGARCGSNEGGVGQLELVVIIAVAAVFRAGFLVAVEGFEADVDEGCGAAEHQDDGHCSGLVVVVVVVVVFWSLGFEVEECLDAVGVWKRLGWASWESWM